MKTKLRLLAILIGFLNIQFQGQSRIQWFPLNQYEGLKTPFVQNACTDSAGFIWFETHKGIIRFNGLRFESPNYQFNLDSTILSNSPDGRLWFINKHELGILGNNQIIKKKLSKKMRNILKNAKDYHIIPGKTINRYPEFALAIRGQDTSYIAVHQNKSFHIIPFISKELKDSKICDNGDIWVHFADNKKAKYLRHIVNNRYQDYPLDFISGYTFMKGAFNQFEKTFFSFYPNYFLMFDGKGIHRISSDALKKKSAIFHTSFEKFNSELYLSIMVLRKKNSIDRPHQFSEVYRVSNGVFEKVDFFEQFKRKNSTEISLYSNDKKMLASVYDQFENTLNIYEKESADWRKIITADPGIMLKNINFSENKFLVNTFPIKSPGIFFIQTDKTYNFFEDIKISQIELDKRKNVFFSVKHLGIDRIVRTNENRDGGLWIWDGSKLKQFTIRSNLFSNYIENIKTLDSNEFFILTDNGINKGKWSNDNFRIIKLEKTKGIWADNIIKLNSKTHIAWYSKPSALNAKQKQEVNTIFEIGSDYSTSIVHPLPEVITSIRYQQVYLNKKEEIILSILSDSISSFKLNGTSWEENNDHTHSCLYLGKIDSNNFFIEKSGKIFSGERKEPIGNLGMDIQFDDYGQDLNIAFFDTKFGLIVFDKGDITNTFHLIKNGVVYPIPIIGNPIEIRYYDPRLKHNCIPFRSGYILNTTVEPYFFSGDHLFPLGSDHHALIQSKNNSLIKVDLVGPYFEQILTIENLELKSHYPYISQIKSDSLEFNYTDKIVLDFTDNNFSIKYGVLEFNKPEEIKYTTILKGYDAKWSDYNDENQTNFKNVPEGKYTFLIKSLNYFGEVSESNQVEITVKPPFYRTWWFYSIEGLTGLLLLGLILQVQRKRFSRKKLEEIKNIESKRQHEELEYARKVQLSMLPDANIDLPDIHIVGFMQTASEVGGDFYDYFELQENKIAVVLGDATGHGVGAGLMVGMIKSAVTQSLSSDIGRIPLAEIMEKLNQTLRRSLSQRGLGMCLSIAIINRDSGKTEISSVGLPYPYHYTAKTQELKPISLDGPPLGLMENIRTNHQEITLANDDLLVFLSDGLPERMRDDDALWGYENMETLIGEVCQRYLPPDGIIKYVFEKCDLFAGGRSNDDDMTMVVVQKRTIRN